LSTRIVYIMGAGRSGSTLFGILLGNGPGLFYAGELDAWIRRRGVPNGTDAALADFWGPVAERMRAWLDGPHPDFFHAFEHPRSLLRRRGRHDRVARTAYRRYSRELFEAIRDESGGEVIIDSSHYPLRRWHLRGLPELDIRTILLVRDPRAVVGSLRNPVQTTTKSSWGGAAYLWVVHPLSVAVYFFLPSSRRLLVRYEDFVDDPNGELDRIGVWLGVDFSSIDPSHLIPGPVFQGNRVRTNSVVRISKRSSSREGVGLMIGLALAPWVLAFGYGRLRRGGQNRE
jgi:Sulfotransferase family